MVRNIIVDAGGSLHLIDGALARHSRFDSAGDYVESHSLPAVVTGGYGRQAVILRSGRIVINLKPKTARDSSGALLVVDTNGTTSTFEVDSQPPEARRPWMSERLLWPTGDGGLISIHPYSFVVDIYDELLTRTDRIALQAEWIPRNEPEEEIYDGVFDRPFTPHVSGAWVDSTGLLWLVVMLPDNDWRAGPQMKDGLALGPDSLEALVQRPRAGTVVHVIDLAARRVVARSRFGQDVGSTFGQGYFVTNAEGTTQGIGARVTQMQFHHTIGGREQ